MCFMSRTIIVCVRTSTTNLTRVFRARIILLILPPPLVLSPHLHYIHKRAHFYFYPAVKHKYCCVDRYTRLMKNIIKKNFISCVIVRGHRDDLRKWYSIIVPRMLLLLIHHVASSQSFVVSVTMC